MAVTIERRIHVDAEPARVFAHVHDPELRPTWDPMTDLCRVEGAGRPRPGARLHLRGRRNAPSWVGEYEVYEPPRRSVVRLVEGVGMPFRDFTQTLEVARDGTRTELVYRLSYDIAAPLRLIEPFTMRRKLLRAASHAVANVRRDLG
jgi:uncharacterized protein YndB with AHSA1/START domain